MATTTPRISEIVAMKVAAFLNKSDQCIGNLLMAKNTLNSYNLSIYESVHGHLIVYFSHLKKHRKFNFGDPNLFDNVINYVKETMPKW